MHKLLTRADLPIDARILRLFAGSRRREARESVSRGRGKTVAKSSVEARRAMTKFVRSTNPRIFTGIRRVGGTRSKQPSAVGFRSLRRRVVLLFDVFPVLILRFKHNLLCLLLYLLNLSLNL